MYLKRILSPWCERVHRLHECELMKVSVLPQRHALVSGANCVLLAGWHFTALGQTMKEVTFVMLPYLPRFPLAGP